MAIHTVHLIIGVLLINLIFGLGANLGETYVQGTTNIQSNLTDLITTSNNMEDAYNRTLLNVDESGSIYNSGIRENTGTAPQYPEAALNLGSNFDLWSGLAIQAVFPFKISATIQAALASKALAIAAALWVINLLVIGINVMLYKRFWDIVYSKMHN